MQIFYTFFALFACIVEDYVNSANNSSKWNQTEFRNFDNSSTSALSTMITVLNTMVAEASVNATISPEMYTLISSTSASPTTVTKINILPLPLLKSAITVNTISKEHAETTAKNLQLVTTAVKQSLTALHKAETLPRDQVQKATITEEFTVKATTDEKPVIQSQTEAVLSTTLTNAAVTEPTKITVLQAPTSVTNIGLQTPLASIRSMTVPEISTTTIRTLANLENMLATPTNIDIAVEGIMSETDVVRATSSVMTAVSSQAQTIPSPSATTDTSVIPSLTTPTLSMTETTLNVLSSEIPSHLAKIFTKTTVIPTLLPSLPHLAVETMSVTEATTTSKTNSKTSVTTLETLIPDEISNIRIINDSKMLERKQSEAELIFLYTIWRHGDRAPLSIYPTDPYRESTWPNGLGELTEIGMRQLFKIGRRMKQQYINCTPSFLSKNYNHREIYLRSTNVNRSLVSAMALAAGMFSNGIAGKDYPRMEDEEEWPHGWIPIPIHTKDVKYDYSANPFRRCHRAQFLEQQGFELLMYISNVTGNRKLKPEQNLYHVYDTLIVERFHNLIQPKWFTTQIEKEMKVLRMELRKYKYFGNNSELIRLRGGAILAEIINRLIKKWKCIKEADRECFWYRKIKFYGLSAHDTTLAALLTALEANVKDADINGPQYGATATFELYRVNNKPYIKFLYSNIYSDAPRAMTHLVPECSSTFDLCPLRKFVTGRRRFLPVNIKKECSIKRNRIQRS